MKGRMTVRVLRGFCLGDGMDAEVDEIIELPLHDAAIKIRQGKVKDVNTKSKVKAEQEKEEKELLEYNKKEKNHG